MKIVDCSLKIHQTCSSKLRSLEYQEISSMQIMRFLGRKFFNYFLGLLNIPNKTEKLIKKLFIRLSTEIFF